MAVKQQTGEIITVQLTQLAEAAWNYKTDGTEEMIAKLAASIEQDGSAGVPAVREIGQGKYEVIDGNHRLKAVRRVKWATLTVESFGKISIAKAALIARRRNHIWFADDILKYAELLKNTITPEISVEEMSKYMPESEDEIRALIDSLAFDWSMFDRGDDGIDHTGQIILRLILTREADRLWKRFKLEAKLADDHIAFNALMHRHFNLQHKLPSTSREVSHAKRKGQDEEQKTRRAKTVGSSSR